MEIHQWRRWDSQIGHVERIFIYTYILYRALYTLSYPVSIAYSTHIPMGCKGQNLITDYLMLQFALYCIFIPTGRSIYPEGQLHDARPHTAMWHLALDAWHRMAIIRNANLGCRADGCTWTYIYSVKLEVQVHSRILLRGPSWVATLTLSQHSIPPAFTSK